MCGRVSMSVVIKLEDSKVHSVAHNDSEEAAFTFIQANSAACTVLITACIRFSAFFTSIIIISLGVTSREGR